MADTTSGFYKLSKDGGTLLHAPNRVTSKEFSLDAKSPPKSGAVDGWEWHPDRETACKALGYVEPEPEPEPEARPCARNDCPNRIGV